LKGMRGRLPWTKVVREQEHGQRGTSKKAKGESKDDFNIWKKALLVDGNQGDGGLGLMCALKKEGRKGKKIEGAKRSTGKIVVRVHKGL